MRVRKVRRIFRIRRFIENGTELLALDFPLSCAGDGSTPYTAPMGFTLFVYKQYLDPRYSIFYVRPTNCSSYSSSQCSALPEKIQ